MYRENERYQNNAVHRITGKKYENGQNRYPNATPRVGIIEVLLKNTEYRCAVQKVTRPVVTES